MRPVTVRTDDRPLRVSRRWTTAVVGMSVLVGAASTTDSPVLFALGMALSFWIFCVAVDTALNYMDDRRPPPDGARLLRLPDREW